MEIERFEHLPEVSSLEDTSLCRLPETTYSTDAMQRLRFPMKLYFIVNDDTTDSIQWTSDGRAIIMRYKQFAKDYLKDNGLFKTSSISSFIRQLNLYGFRKIRTRNPNAGVNRFFHEFFHRGCFGQLDLIKRPAGNKRRRHVHPRKKILMKLCHHANNWSHVFDEPCPESQGCSSGVKQRKPKHPKNGQYFNNKIEEDGDDDDDDGDSDGDRESNGTNQPITSTETSYVNSASYLSQYERTNNKHQTEKILQRSQNLPESNKFPCKRSVENKQDGQYEIKAPPVDTTAQQLLNQTVSKGTYFKETSDKSTMTSAISSPFTAVQLIGSQENMHEAEKSPCTTVPQSFLDECMQLRQNHEKSYIESLQPSQSEANAWQSTMEMKHTPPDKNGTGLVTAPDIHTVNISDVLQKNQASGRTSLFLNSPQYTTKIPNATTSTAGDCFNQENSEIQKLQPTCIPYGNGVLIYLPLRLNTGCACLKSDSNVQKENLYNINCQHSFAPAFPQSINSMVQNGFHLPEMHHMDGPVFSTTMSDNGRTCDVPRGNLHQDSLPYATPFPYSFQGNSHDNMAFQEGI